MLELLLVPVLLSGAALLAHAHQRPPKRLSILAVKANRRTQSSIAADRSFLDNVATRAMYGLLLGTLGLEKSQNPDLIAFAERMIQENQAIHVELTSIIQAKGIPAAGALHPDQRGVLEQLAQLPGPVFDSQFLTLAVTAHQEMLRVFTEETQAAKDKTLHRFASDTITRLRSHLRLARRAEASLGAQSGRNPLN